MTAIVTSDRPVVDLLDPIFHVGDPHPAYRWMRQHEPVYRDTNGIWCVTRMEHLRDVERHAPTFVSSKGYRSVWFPAETSMISKDDPGHTEQRRLVADRFTPKAVAALESEVRGIVTRALSMVELTSQFEVVDTIAARLPATLTCRLIGWPDAHWREVSSWSERLMRVDTLAVNPTQMSDTIRAVHELATLTATTVEARRACPAEDLMSRWANGTLDGEPMSLAEINSELGLVIPGGAETTRTTLARALILFSERPELWDWLAEDQGRIPHAVEELLRWITPLNNMFRTAAADAEIGGVPIEAGDRIALVYPSANRDDLVFDDPDQVDLERDPNPHISFGFGTHFCLGAHVARLSLRVALEELTARFTNLRPVSVPSYESNVFVKAVERFDLAFDRR
ncbi:MAG TPA: cytochrome P450 [Microthrixaceae bacterium]|nr:cytochrome P450 [Microthrixaceae bacterium]